MTENVVIVGSGPAGYTAAIYAARARLDPLVLAGRESGGQLMLTTDVENYPGFPDGVQGPELMEKFRAQAERFGARVIDKNAQSVDLSSRPFKITYEDAEPVEAKALIVATGADARWLGLESEQALRGHGVSSCATCDGAFFRDKVLCVIGGGDSAMEEALFLTKFATKVYIIHRRGELRASKIMQERAKKHEKIEIIWNSVVEQVLGDKVVEGVRLRNVDTDEESTLELQGFFVAIGHTPNTKVFADWLDLDPQAYVKLSHGHLSTTNIEGVFAAGDVHDARYRQAITAAASGCKAAIDAERWLEAQEFEETAKAAA